VTGIRLERQGPLCVLRLDKGRGNSIDEPLVAALGEACSELARDAGVRGVLLASAHPKLFCPGLDLQTLIGYERPAMEAFMLRFAEAMWALYALRQPVVAAVSGHAVAGGCVLALTADVRVLRRGGVQIGLNEVRVGVPLPWSVALLLRASVPGASLTDVALLGRNFADEEALAVGIVHALADAEGFESACLARLQELAEKDAAALGTTKAYLRAETLAAMKAHERQHIGEFLDGWFSATTQQRIRQTIEGLKAR
jgi:enoyl-CoA hydratase